MSFFFNKGNKWKSKAKDKTNEIKKLKKKNKELLTSRNKWKIKVEELKKLNKFLEEELKKN